MSFCDGLFRKGSTTKDKYDIATVGNRVPNVDLYVKFPPEKVNLVEYCAEKSVILLGLPGAFTPTWSNQQVPNYLSSQDALKSLGVDSVVVWCVNDSAVMEAWEKDQKNEDSPMIKFMGDPHGALTNALDMRLVHEGVIDGAGLVGRCKRHAVYAVNGEIKIVKISETPDDPAGADNPSLTMADAMIEAIKEIQ